MIDASETSVNKPSADLHRYTSGKSTGLGDNTTTPSRSPAYIVMHKEDVAAWVLAFLPVATTLCLILAAMVGVSQNVVSVVALLISAALVVVDKRDLVRTGRVPRSSLPRTTWFLISPVYLFKRARRLGEPKTKFWVSIASSMLAFIVSIAIVVTAAARLVDAEPVLPGCADRGSIPDVVNAFDTVEDVRNAGLHGVIVTDQIEIAQGPGQRPTTRLCSGMMQASNARDYKIQYEFEVEQGQVIVTVELQ